MTDEATQQGVSESEYAFGADRLARINSIQESRNSDRETDDDEDALAALTQQAEDLDNQLREHDPNAGEETAESDDDEDGDQELADRVQQEHADEEAGEDDQGASDDADQEDGESESPLFMEDGQWMTRVKVDGEIKAIPFARLQAAAQKLEAGDKRLEEANRLRQEIEQREQQLMQKERELLNQPPAQGADGQGQTETDQPNEEVRALIKRYHEALLDGEDEDVTSNLLAQLATAGRQQPQVDVSLLAEQVERQVEARIQKRQQEAAQQAELSDAFTTFKDEFKDIAADQELLRMADRLTVAVSQEYPTYTPLEVMREAGKRTRKWLQEKTGDASRVSRKRNLKTATGAGARQPGKPEEKPKTRSDQINEIRAARGQMPLG